jgi:L-iditol 2-dehydrogenase
MNERSDHLQFEIPTEMKAALFTGIEQIAFRTLPIPEPAEDEVLVKMRSCAICTWDQRAYLGINKIDYPFVGGHEVFATVVKVGSAVSDASCGDEVALGLMSSCGDCYYCNRGQEGVCENFDYNRRVGGLPFAGTGGFCEYLVVKERSLFHFSESVDPTIGVFAEPLSCVNHSIERIGSEDRHSAVIIGAGTMGLLHLLMLRDRVETIIISEPSAERREFAARLGADAVIDPGAVDSVAVVKELTNGRGADIVIDATAVLSIAHDVLGMVAPMGTVIYYSSIYPKEQILIDPNQIHKSMAAITGSANSNTHDFNRAVELLSNRTIDPRSLVSAVYPFESIQEAFTESLRSDNYRTVLTFS